MAPKKPARQQRDVRLSLVSPRDGNPPNADVDIIAIHGLDTTSPGTWTWDTTKCEESDISKHPDYPKGHCVVNWLQDPGMLPAKVGSARIFTCDWPAAMFEPTYLAQMSDQQFASHLLAGIKNRESATDDRPILFIASCLGGIILMNALIIASDSDDYRAIRRATRGVIFLATPFRGTSLQAVAEWADFLLKTQARFKRKVLTTLLHLVNGKEVVDLRHIVSRFTRLCPDQACPCRVANFFELGKTNLGKKAGIGFMAEKEAKEVRNALLAAY